MKILYSLMLTGFLAIPVCSLAQNETNHWMFGKNAGVDFSSGIPVPEQGCIIYSIPPTEGTASISDPVTGKLLIYTDGVTVFAGNHTIMPNGTSLKGDYSSTQSALIVPKPGSSTLFYIFTSHVQDINGVNFGYNYTIVDMTLNGGLGDVVYAQKNVLLYAPSGEQLSAVKHANGTDWWVMTKELGTNVYRAYLLTSTGVLGPVNSAIGIGNSYACIGQAKFSPDGTRYAIATMTGNSLTNAFTQLFDFDNATGLLSNPITLWNGTQQMCYGLSFSSDNSKLYIGCGGGHPGTCQYDLCSGIPAKIIASATVVGGSTGPFQLGKDFKIYAPGLDSSLSVINYPNVLGVACGSSASSVPIAGKCSIGLCNFPDSYFNQGNGDPCPEMDIPKEAELIPQIPNVITPNGDGVNDVFTIENLPPASSIDILNRWGNPVLTTENYTNDWMGNKSDGVYFYRLKTPDGRSFSGFVQVVTGG